MSSQDKSDLPQRSATDTSQASKEATGGAAKPAATKMSAQHKATLLIIGIAALAGLGGLIFGYDQGSVGDAQGDLNPPQGFVGAFRLNSFELGLVTSMVGLFALGGALAASPISDRFGRRATNMIASVLSVIGGLGMAFAVSAGMLIVARAILGVSVGLIAAAVPHYIGEMAPARSRGKMVSAYQLAITMGIFISALVGLAEFDDMANGWRIILGAIIIPAIAFGVAMTFMPDTPRWLVSNGRFDQARRILHKTEGPEMGERTLASITTELETMRESTWGDLFRPLLRPAITVGITLAIIQQLSLINGIIYYGTSIFHQLGFSTTKDATVASLIFIYLVNMLSTLIAMPIVDRFGRKPLMLAGCTGMCVAFIGAAVATAEGASRGGTAGWVLVGSVSLFICSFAFSLGPIVWVVISEIFPTRDRAKGIALCVAANWFFVFLVAIATPSMMAFSPVLYFVAGFVFMGLSFFYVAFRVPETKGRALEDILRIWEKRSGIKAGEEDERLADDLGESIPA